MKTEAIDELLRTAFRDLVRHYVEGHMKVEDAAIASGIQKEIARKHLRGLGLIRSNRRDPRPPDPLHVQRMCKCHVPAMGHLFFDPDLRKCSNCGVSLKRHQRNPFMCNKRNWSQEKALNRKYKGFGRIGVDFLATQE